MQVIAISTDEREDSQRFADKHRMWFPLVADTDASISKAYVGLDSNGYSVPGVLLVRADGKIAFRHFGKTASDRVYAGEILDVIDEKLSPQDASPPGK